MQPNLIRNTAKSALELQGARGHGTPEAFLLSWVAWEGLKVRLLVAGLAKMGWQVQHIYEVLGVERVFVLDDYRRTFKTIFGGYPENLRGVGTSWRKLEEARHIRNRYVHGMGIASPDRLREATNSITASTLDATWLGRLTVPSGDARVEIGDPCRRLATPRSRARSKSELRQLIHDAKRSPR